MKVKVIKEYFDKELKKLVSSGVLEVTKERAKVLIAAKVAEAMPEEEATPDAEPTEKPKKKTGGKKKAEA